MNQLAFSPFLDNVEPLLEKYDMVFRISKEENEGLCLVITPVPKSEKTIKYQPTRITGSPLEIATILDDPQTGIVEYAKQATRMILVPIDESTVKTPGKRGPKPKTEKLESQPIETVTDVAIEKEPKTLDQVTETEERSSILEDPFLKEVNEPISIETQPEQDRSESIVPDEPPASAPAASANALEDKANPESVRSSIFNKHPDPGAITEHSSEAEKMINNDDPHESYRTLSRNITLELRGLFTDWNEVSEMWKSLMGIYRDKMDKKSQDNYKDNLRGLHESIKLKQAKDKELINDQKK